jgi:hypothetical protein
MDPVTHVNVHVTTPANNPKPIRITAMSLPWGGLLDINGDWKSPHLTHNNGRVVDLGLRDYAAPAGGWDMNLVLLLRYVVYQDGGSCPVLKEGGDLTPGGATFASAAPHLHVVL